MLKLYLKKLLSAVMLMFLFAVLLFFGFVILQIIAIFANLNKDNYILNITVSLISAVISLIVIYCIRVNNIIKRATYIKDLSGCKFSFWKHIVYILKSKDYIAEILALQTFCLPMFLYVGITAKTPLLPFAVGTVLLVLLSIVLYSIIDIPIWFLVYKKWDKK